MYIEHIEQVCAVSGLEFASVKTSWYDEVIYLP